ncbi:MAG: flagellar hook-length control protein FliK [Lachnospiraceae bacterium]
MPESMISGLSQNTDTRIRTNGKSDAKAAETQQGMFSALLGQVSVQTDTASFDKNTQTKAAKQDQTVDLQQSKSKLQFKQMTGRNEQMQPQKVQDAMQSFQNQADAMLKDAFGVTDEQIEEAMEKLGLTYENLLQPTALMQLATELTGNSDVSSLLLNSDFSQMMGQWQNLTQDLQEELGLSAEELQKLSDAMLQQQTGKVESSEQEDAAEQSVTQSLNQQPKTEESQQAKTASENSKTMQDKEATEEVTENPVTDEAGYKQSEKTQTETSEREVLQPQTEQMPNITEGNEKVSDTESVQLQQTADPVDSQELAVTEDAKKVSTKETLQTGQNVQTAQKVEERSETGSDDQDKPILEKEAPTRMEKAEEASQQENTQSQEDSNGEAGRQTTDRRQMSSKEMISQEQTQEASAQKTQEPSKVTHGKAETTPNPVHGMQSQQLSATQQTTQPAQAATQQVDAQAIIEQITKFAKTHISLDGTTISMQLNPEHLGKVYLQASYKNGVLTAQLAAQDSAVKDAIEHQISRLQESLNQQGIKVQAIEVTIASHEFEQNLEGNQHQMSQEMGQQNQQEQERQQARRNLNLNEENIQALFEDLSEDDSLKAKMMLENGNSVDMTA